MNLRNGPEINWGGRVPPSPPRGRATDLGGSRDIGAPLKLGPRQFALAAPSLALGVMNSWVLT